MTVNFRFRLFYLSTSLTISIELDLTNLRSAIVASVVVVSVKDDANRLTALGFSNSISMITFILMCN